ncbi:MAG: hypothetical protein ACJ8LL_02645, partial [Candidatus Udaeobacter sp.]
LSDAESSSSKRCMTDVAFSRPATGHPRGFGVAEFDGASVGPHAGRDESLGHSPCGGGHRVDETQSPSLPEVAATGEIPRMP